MREPTTLHIPSPSGGELAVHDYGGNGRPTFFIHGTGMCSRMWEPVLDLLDPTVFRPIGVDLRFHGQSRTPADATYTESDVADDLLTAVNGIGVTNAWAVGHSMGGATAMLTSAFHPKLLERLWVYEPIIFPRPPGVLDGPSEFVEATKRRRPEFPTRADAIARYGSRPPLDELDPAALAAYVEHGFVDQPDGTVRLACEPEFEARAFEQFLTDGYSHLAKVTVPTMVGYGAKSNDMSGEWAPKIATELPDGTAAPFAESAHFGPFGEVAFAASSITEWFLQQ